MKLGLLIVSALLFIGVFTLPYGYYTFLRIVVFIACIAIIVQEYQGEVTPALILFGLIGILFNPIIRVSLHDKTLWAIIDFVVAIIFLVKSLTLKKQ